MRIDFRWEEVWLTFHAILADHIELSLYASFDGNLLTARSRWGVDGMISDI